MRVLLDTQCWLWMQAEPDRFRSETRKLLLDPSNELFLSAASSWEIAIHLIGCWSHRPNSKHYRS